MASKLDVAARDLNAALDLLQAGIERRRVAGAKAGELESEVQTLNSDRARLADKLDKAEARAAKLEAANRDVSNRLVKAMESVRGIITRVDTGPA